MSFAAVIPLLGTLLDRVLPDKQASEAAKLKLLELTQRGELAELEADVKLRLAAAENVKAEAQSTNWLTSSWRPIAMLVFTALIVLRFLGYTVEGIGESEYLELWGVVKISLGGYTIGRSAEKIVPSVIAAVKQK